MYAPKKSLHMKLTYLSVDPSSTAIDWYDIHLKKLMKSEGDYVTEIF